MAARTVAQALEQAEIRPDDSGYATITSDLMIQFAFPGQHTACRSTELTNGHQVTQVLCHGEQSAVYAFVNDLPHDEQIGITVEYQPDPNGYEDELLE